MRALTIRQIAPEDEEALGRGIEIVDLATGESTGSLTQDEAIRHIVAHWPAEAGAAFVMRTPAEWIRRRGVRRVKREPAPELTGAR